MAQRLEVIYEDDLTGGPADGTVTFGLGSQAYEIDLSAKNRAKLEKSLAPFLGAASKVGAGNRRKAAQPKNDQRDVRAWAKAQGMRISDRGRIPADVLSQYEAAH